MGEGVFINYDVGSFYPSLMIEYEFLSRNVKHAEKFKDIYDYRMKLKHEGKKKEQAPYKIHQRINMITYMIHYKLIMYM